MENPYRQLIANGHLNCTQNGMVQAWVGHFVTPLKHRHNESDWWVTSQKPHKKHRLPNNHHHYGVGDACPLAPPAAWIWWTYASGGVDGLAHVPSETAFEAI